MTQLSLLALFFYLIIRNLISEDTSGSAEAFCPLGGLASLWSYITEGKTLPHTHYSNIAMLAILIVATILLGKGFCGWLCPLGTIQDFMNKLGLKFFKRKKVKSPWLLAVDRYLRYARFVILALLLAGTIGWGTLVFQDYDPIIALIKLSEAGLTIAVGLFILVLVASLFIKRPWCNYFCPLGAFMAIIGKLSFTAVKRNPSSCKSCGICSTNCPAGIEVHKVTSVGSLSCINCFQCISTCPQENALSLTTKMGGKKHDI